MSRFWSVFIPGVARFGACSGFAVDNACFGYVLVQGWAGKEPWTGTSYPQELRDRVLAAYDRGMMTKQIAELFQMSPAWARRLKQRRRETGETSPRPMGGARVIKIDMKQLASLVESESTVLIEGKRGTGKELFARAVHDLSPRAQGPYLLVKCAALPETLLESELFGYKKGAFTDARRDKPGSFDLAQGGSVFLDEVETLTRAVQVKLLRVIENKQYQPLGGTQQQQADVRIIAATNRALLNMVRRGKFRDDLYYRLNVVTLELPALRDRREDIPVLVDHFIGQYNLAKGKEVIGVTGRAMGVLMEYDFPGNVRELQNVIEHAFVLCDWGLIDLPHLPRTILRSSPPRDGLTSDPTIQRSRRSSLNDAEAAAIRDALERHNGHRANTARELGISTSTLWRRMSRLGIRFRR